MLHGCGPRRIPCLRTGGSHYHRGSLLRRLACLACLAPALACALELFLLVAGVSPYVTKLLAYNLVFIVINDLATGQWLVSAMSLQEFFFEFGFVFYFITGNREDSWVVLPPREPMLRGE